MSKIILSKKFLFIAYPVMVDQWKNKKLSQGMKTLWDGRGIILFKLIPPQVK
jgi:hypothetical protein